MLFTRSQRWLTEFNLYDTGSTEIEVIQQERWSTRVHIVLLLTIICSLAIYTALDYHTTYITMKNPSYDTFMFLQQKFAVTLKCPCSNIAIKYEAFTQLQPSYHQVIHVLYSLIS